MTAALEKFANTSDDSLSVSGTATEEGRNGVFNAEVCRGIYNVTVKKNGYLAAKAEAVMIDSEETFTLDMGELIPGDIIDGNGCEVGFAGILYNSISE